MSRNKREGRYIAYRYGKHFRSINRLLGFIRADYGNPFGNYFVRKIK